MKFRTGSVTQEVISPNYITYSKLYLPTQIDGKYHCPNSPLSAGLYNGTN